MELYQLKSFVAIAKSRNLTRAADSLHISQSALSTQLKILEEELGVSLFSRTPKGMDLTMPGHALLEHAGEVICAAENLRSKASQLSSNVSGSLAFGLHTDPCFLRINAIGKQMAEVMPSVSVDYVSCKTKQAPEMLRGRKIDIGFVYGDVVGKDLTQTEIAQVRVRVVMHKDYLRQGQVLDWPDIAKLPMIWSGCECPFHSLLQAKLDEYHLKPIRTHAVDQSLMKGLVLDGCGLGLIREDEAVKLAAEHSNVTIWEHGELLLPLRITWLSNRENDVHIRIATEIIRNHWREASHDGN
jgi:DNA-binding transcriptional LysR family regulator